MKEEEQEDDTNFEEFEERQGYLFWRGYGEKKRREKTRKETFFSRDVQVKNALKEHGISIYNPREDKILLSSVNDVISDEGQYIDINKKVNELIQKVEGYEEDISKEKGDKDGKDKGQGHQESNDKSQEKPSSDGTEQKTPPPEEENNNS
jgi:hypothetical protein